MSDSATWFVCGRCLAETGEHVALDSGETTTQVIDGVTWTTNHCANGHSTFVRANKGMLDLGIVRRVPGDEDNDLSFFMEQWE